MTRTIHTAAATEHPRRPARRGHRRVAPAVGFAVGLGLAFGGPGLVANAAEASAGADTAQESVEAAADRVYSSPVPSGTEVTADFDNPDYRGHLGTDYGTPTGTPITSVTDGKVLRVEDGKTVGDTSPSSALKHHTGNGLVVAHGDINGDEMYTYYGHLSSVDVKPGDTVEAGTKLGESGNTGNSEGPHLHFGVFLNSAEPSGAMWKSSTGVGFIDPHDWLDRKGVDAGADSPVKS